MAKDKEKKNYSLKITDLLEEDFKFLFPLVKARCSKFIELSNEKNIENLLTYIESFDIETFDFNLHDSTLIKGDEYSKLYSLILLSKDGRITHTENCFKINTNIFEIIDACFLNNLDADKALSVIFEGFANLKNTGHFLNIKLVDSRDNITKDLYTYLFEKSFQFGNFEFIEYFLKLNRSFSPSQSFFIQKFCKFLSFKIYNARENKQELSDILKLLLTYDFTPGINIFITKFLKLIYGYELVKDQENLIMYLKEAVSSENENLNYNIFNEFIRNSNEFRKFYPEQYSFEAHLKNKFLEKIESTYKKYEAKNTLYTYESLIFKNINNGINLVNKNNSDKEIWDQIPIIFNLYISHLLDKSEINIFETNALQNIIDSIKDNPVIKINFSNYDVIDLIKIYYSGQCVDSINLASNFLALTFNHSNFNIKSFLNNKEYGEVPANKNLGLFCLVTHSKINFKIVADKELNGLFDIDKFFIHLEKYKFHLELNSFHYENIVSNLAFIIRNNFKGNNKVNEQIEKSYDLFQSKLLGNFNKKFISHFNKKKFCNDVFCEAKNLFNYYTPIQKTIESKISPPSPVKHQAPRRTRGW